MVFGVSGYITTASPVNPEVNTKSKLLYRYEYGMGAVDIANGTCFTYGLYICSDDSSFCTFTPHNTGGTVPTTCLGEGNYQA